MAISRVEERFQRLLQSFKEFRLSTKVIKVEVKGKTTFHMEAEVDFVKLKEMAKEMLPSDSNLRMLILSEPDNLPAEKALAKIEIYLKLLYKEFGKS